MNTSSYKVFSHYKKFELNAVAVSKSTAEYLPVEQTHLSCF